MNKMPVFIIGFMGSGKTTTGRQLAKSFGYAFIDLDKEIETAAGKTIEQIFNKEGEACFRELERKMLIHYTTHTATVISCGGGTPCFFDNMDIMNKSGITVYLQLTASQLFSRLNNSKSKRPLLGGKTGDTLYNFIEAKLDERQKYYLKAQHIVNGLNVKVSAIAQLING